MGKNSERVIEFVAAIGQNEKDRILSFFTENANYHNIPLDPVSGHEAIWKELALIHDQASEIDWQVHHIAESEDGMVLTERTDRYRIQGAWVAFPVMGIFEFESEKISGWRD